MNNTGNESQDGQHDVDPEVLPDTDLQEHAQRRQYDRGDYANYIQNVPLKVLDDILMAIPNIAYYYAPPLPESPSDDSSHRGKRLQKIRWDSSHGFTNGRRTRLSSRRRTLVPPPAVRSAQN